MRENNPTNSKPFLPLAAAFAAGILAAHFVALSLTALAAALTLVLIASLALLRRSCGWAALLMLWVLLGACRMALWRDPGPLPPPQFGEAPAALFEIESLEPRYDGALLGMARMRAHCRPECRAADARVILRLEQDGPAIHPGGRYWMQGALSPLQSARNPGNWDARVYAWQRVRGTWAVGAFDAVLAAGAARSRPLSRLHAACRERLEAALPARYAALLRCLLLGERRALSPEDRELFVENGTMHLLVISGFHVGVAALFCDVLLRFLGAPYRPRLILTGAAILAYAAFAGWNAPAVRAALMGCAYLAARWSDRPLNWWNAWSAAAVAQLALDPAQLFMAGFQLSFGAVAALLLFAGPLAAVFERALAGLPAFARRYIAFNIAATLAVWILLWPLFSHYFARFSITAPLANLAAVPLVALAVIIGWCVLFLAFLGFPGWIFAPAKWLLAALLGIQEALPAHAWVSGHLPAPVVLIYWILLFALWRDLRARRNHARLRAAAASVALLWFGALYSFRSTPELHAIDVGHGDALLVRDGARALLIDTGTREAAIFRVIPYLRFLGIGALDAVVLTHDDSDHSGGLEPVLAAMPVGVILTNGRNNDTMTAQHNRAALRRKKVPARALRRGERVTAGSVHLEVLHPPAESGAEGNDASLVLRLIAPGMTALLTGDAEEAALGELLRYEIRSGTPVVRAQILKMPHHGSALGLAGPALLSRAQPELVFISAGGRGLPSRETLELLRQARVPVLQTQACGTLIFRASAEVGDLNIRGSRCPEFSARREE